MPKYSAKLTVPPGTTQASPIEEKLKVSSGRIVQVTVTWTPGSQWYNALIVEWEGSQIIPSTGGGQCRGDGYPDTWPEHINLDRPQPELVIKAWNEGNTYEHDAIVDIVVSPIPPDILAPIKEMINLLKRLVTG